MRAARGCSGENGGYAQIEAYDGRDAVVIPRMAELGWRLADRLDIDFLFEKS